MRIGEKLYHIRFRMWRGGIGIGLGSLVSTALRATLHADAVRALQ
jgi:hypothetical protein